MKKKSIVLIATAVMLMASLVVGGTLAYFTDKDAETNVFTTGNVDIDLLENFEQNSKLLPTTGKDADGKYTNAVQKEVYVKNLGSEDAFVRVHIAIPNVLDNGDPSFDASANVLHFNYAKESVGEGLWDWSKTTGAAYEGDWNYYETTIGEIKYNVYVVTYGTALKTGEETAQKAMNQVYLDSKVTNEDVTAIKDALGDKWEIKVVAEGAQAAGFADAYAALNAAFGVPGTYDPFAVAAGE